MTQPQLPPWTVLTCPADASHKIRTRQPPGSVLLCTACGQSGRHGVTVTVPAPLPAIRPEITPDPAGVAVVLRCKTGPERWHCAGCLGTAPAPAPGEPPLGWLELRAGVPARESRAAESELLIRACRAECLAKALPAVQDRLAGLPWLPPEPGPGGSVQQLMSEKPRGR